MSSADTLLGRLEGVQGRGPRWRAICPVLTCPAHESRRRARALSIYETDDGRTLLHCFAGCDVAAIVAAVGLDLADLFRPRGDDDQRAPRVQRPWSVRDLAAALRAETMVAWVTLADLAAGRALSDADRNRAALAADRAAHLLAELERAS